MNIIIIYCICCWLYEIVQFMRDPTWIDQLMEDIPDTAPLKGAVSFLATVLFIALAPVITPIYTVADITRHVRRKRRRY